MKRVICLLFCLLFFACNGRVEVASSPASADEKDPLQNPSQPEKDLLGVAPSDPKADSANGDGGVATSYDASNTAVWTVSNQWADVDTEAAKKSGIAWTANSGLNWFGKYQAWVKGLVRTRSTTGPYYYDTFELVTPWGKHLPAPSLEGSELAYFLITTFAAWYNLPLMIEGYGGGQSIYFGHFGERAGGGQNLGPLYQTAYKDYTAQFANSSDDTVISSWPKDSKLRNQSIATLDVTQKALVSTLGKCSTDANCPYGEGCHYGKCYAKIGTYLDELFLNKRTGYFILRLLNRFSSLHLASSRNTYHIKSAEIKEGDLLIHRYQKEGQGRAFVVKGVKAVESLKQEIFIAAGNIERRQPQLFTSRVSRLELVHKSSGCGVYKQFNGGVKRFRVPLVQNGKWVNRVMAEDEAGFIPEQSEAASGRCLEFEAISGSDEVEANDDSGASPSIRDDPAADWTWNEQAYAAINKEALPSYFQQIGYVPPEDVELIIAQVVPGVDQPAYIFYDLNGTAFSTSFWPASAVKLLAAIGALEFLATKEMSGDAVVSFRSSSGGNVSKKVWEFYDPAIRVSSNIDYNRLVEIAGFDWFNETFLSAENDLPGTIIQRSYYSGDGIRKSPEMKFVDKGVTLLVPERTGTGDYGCQPRDGNCASLFEMLNALRKVTLQDEIFPMERFQIEPQDLSRLKSALLGSNSYLIDAAKNVWGNSVSIYNKPGFVPGDDYLDHGLIINNATGERYLVAVSVPDTGTSGKAQLTRLVKNALNGLIGSAPKNPMPWQSKAGIRITVQVDDKGRVNGQKQTQLTLEAPGADKIRIWSDSRFLGEVTASSAGFSFITDQLSAGAHLLVLQAEKEGLPIGYRALAIRLP